ncbi:hypothetical protein GOV09_06410 [Candidatus Woesearchaeota archaeon]|nr:hypothetical protein [Candidatus Woesearchaeota archaeon]
MIAIKKAQVSVFIILGLIVLFSVVLFLYFKSTFMITEPDVLTEKLHPVQRFVESCAEQSLDDALSIISQQGGFIDIPTAIDLNPSRYVNPDGLGIIKMPFWFYKGKRYSPSIDSVQQEIKEYVEEHTHECINGFLVFKEEYTIVELDDMTVDAFLNRDDVTVVLDYPIRVSYKANNSHALLEDFRAKRDVRLRKIIETGNKLLDVELNTFWLENFTINLMATNQDVPFTDMLFRCGELSWRVSDVKEEVEEMLTVNLPRVRIKGTDHVPFQRPLKDYEKLLEYTMDDIADRNFPENAPIDAFEYLRMYWDINVEEPTLSIGLQTVPKIGIELIARPHDNGILKSNLIEGQKEYMRFLCINVYHFLYDVNYPVKVTLRDGFAYGGNGYTFTFVLPVTIKNNEPFKENYGLELFTSNTFDRGFCDQTGEEIYDIRVYGKEDGLYNIELNDVNVSLQCFKYNCDLGRTIPDNGAYRLRTTLPEGCANPFITAEKAGYLPAKAQLTENMLELDITKLKNVDFRSVYRRYNSDGDSIGPAEELEDDMQVTIEIAQGDYYQYKTYPSEDNMINLIDGDAEYDLNIILTQGDEIVGGYNGKWSASGGDVVIAESVVFPVLKYVPVPLKKEEKLKMIGYIFEGEYVSQLKPSLE